LDFSFAPLHYFVDTKEKSIHAEPWREEKTRETMNKTEEKQATRQDGFTRTRNDVVKQCFCLSFLPLLVYL
jgi:hypothetical protein